MKYEEPVIDIILFETEEVITLSEYTGVDFEDLI
jgi:hypothetical protein